MHIEQQAGMLGAAAFGHGHVDGDHIADAAGAARQHDDPVGEPRRLLEIVRDVHSRAFLPCPDRQKVFHQELARLGVERRQWLVEQQYRRPHHQGAGDADTLAHAAGKLLGISGREVAEAGHGERSGDPFAALACAEAAVLQRQADVVGNTAPRQQGEILEDVGERVERIGRRGARQGDATGAGLQQAAQDAEQRALAAARWADQRDRLAVGDVEREVGKRFDRPVPVGDFLNVQRHRPPWSPERCGWILAGLPERQPTRWWHPAPP